MQRGTFTLAHTSLDADMVKEEKRVKMVLLTKANMQMTSIAGKEKKHFQMVRGLKANS